MMRQSGSWAFNADLLQNSSTGIANQTLDLLHRSVRLSDLNTTNVAELAMEEGDLLEGPEIFKQFSDVHKQHPNPGEIFELLELFIRTLADQTAKSKALISSSTLAKKKQHTLNYYLAMLRSEMWTWQLIESLFRDLLQTELGQDEENHFDIVQSSDQDLMNELFSQNSKVRRCQIVVDWLEQMHDSEILENFSDKVDYFVENNATMWENTLHQIKNTKSKKMSGLSLDPDGPRRYDMKLHSLDVEDDNRLLKYMFVLIRSGHLDKAQEICVKCGQGWRAATLEGWRLYHDPNFKQFEEVRAPNEGNLTRDVWKAAAWSMSKDENYPVYEKAVYGALTGNLDSLLNVCDSWHDHLWAYLKVLVDVESEQHIRLHKSNSDSPLMDLPAEYWARDYNLNQMFKELDAGSNDRAMREGEMFYSQVQRFLILNNIAGLVELMCDTLKAGEQQPHILRFMTHLVLFLRSVDRVAVEDQMIEIIETYIKYLQFTNQHELIPHYCSVLPTDAQIVTFSAYLSKIHDNELRRKVLDFASQTLINIPAATSLVVRSSLINLTNIFKSTLNPDITIAAEDQVKVDDVISSIDWLLFEDSQLMEALHQCCAYMRIFLAMQQHEEVQQVFAKLPAGCVDELNRRYPDMTEQQNNSLKEFICFTAYMNAQRSFDDWFKHYHQKPVRPSGPTSSHFADSVNHEQQVKQYEQDLQRWSNTSTALTQYAVDLMYRVLLFAGGWMKDKIELNKDEIEGRRAQLRQLRTICLPHITALLVKILQETNRHSECIRVPDLLASEDHQLYAVFSKADLRAFLTKIQESSNYLLDHEKDALGY